MKRTGVGKKYLAGIMSLMILLTGVMSNAPIMTYAAEAGQYEQMDEDPNEPGEEPEMDVTAPVIQATSPVNGTIVGPKDDSVWIYTYDNTELADILVEYRRSGETEYSSFSVVSSGDGKNYDVISARLPVDEFADGDVIEMRLTPKDRSGNTGEVYELSYPVDKQGISIDGFTATHNTETLAVDLTWRAAESAEEPGQQPRDADRYAIYRKEADEDDEDYAYLGRMTAYYNKLDYAFSDVTVPNRTASYTYKVIAYDLYGNADFKEVNVDVTHVNQPPHVALNMPSTVMTGTKIVYDVSGSYDDGYIESLTIDYGDGEMDSGVGSTPTFSHVYELGANETEKTVEVTVTATDGEYLITEQKKELHVINKDLAGSLTVQVVDEDGIPVKEAPVYFNMGSRDQEIVETDNTGKAYFVGVGDSELDILAMQEDEIAVTGEHVIGVYKEGYLPIKRTTRIVNGTTSTVTFTLEENHPVETKLESHRMTRDEIIDAGIDPDDPDNYHAIEYNVTLENDTFRFIQVGDRVVYPDNDFGPGGSWGTGLVYIPAIIAEHIICVLEIPASVSMLKEFFNVKLHIINNSSEDFSLTQNQIHLNMSPATGLTVIDAASSQDVFIKEIKGQSSETVEWILRGDKEGEYTLSADYTGILSDFNREVSATFVNEDPIKVKVCGVSNLKMIMEIPDTFTNGEFYYNLIMRNTGDADDPDQNMYLPGLKGGGELIQTMVTHGYNDENAERSYVEVLPEIMKGQDQIERFYRITDQIYDQLKQYPDYEDFVFHFRKAMVEEVTNYDVPLQIRVISAADLASRYESFRAIPPQVKLIQRDIEYGYEEGTAVIKAEATPADNASYELSYEWFDSAEHDPLENPGEDPSVMVLPEGLAAGVHHYYCRVTAKRKDNGNTARTGILQVDVTVIPRTLNLEWRWMTGTAAGEPVAKPMIYNGSEHRVEAVITNLVGDDEVGLIYEGNTAKNAGTYTAKAVAMTGDETVLNYLLPDDSTCEYSIQEVLPTDPDDITPSDPEDAPVDSDLPVVNIDKITTVGNYTKKTMRIKFPVNAAIDNYRIQYRLTGKKTWKSGWSKGTDTYIIRNLKKYSLSQFRIAGYMKKDDGTWVRGKWSKISYRYMYSVPQKALKAGKKRLTVSWTRDKKATGYQIKYSLKKSMTGVKTVNVKGSKTTTRVIKKLKSGKIYYVCVRPVKKKAGKTYLGILTGKKKSKVY